MPGPDSPDAPPPEVPEEFADAYRAAYREALDDQTPLPSPASVAGHRGEPAVRWRMPVLVAAGALALILAAYLLGRLLSGDSDDASGTPIPSAPAGGEPKPGGGDGSPEDETALEPVAIRSISAGCTSKPGVDSAGKKVSYRVRNAIDGDPTTAWRCDGDASGRVLRLRLPKGTEVGEIGLIPGYAKTDPSSGVDRYAENNRITRVTWTLHGSGDPLVIEQLLDGRPGKREMQSIPVPPISVDRVVLRIEAVTRGARNTTAISEIGVRASPGSG